MTSLITPPIGESPDVPPSPWNMPGSVPGSPTIIAARISCCSTSARRPPLVDFFVIVTAISRRQSHAIASEIDQEMKKLGEAKLGLEGPRKAAGP